MNTIMPDSLSLGKNNPPVEISYQNVKDFPYHWHDYLEIIIVLQGSIRLFAGTENIILNTGEIEILNFNEIHRIVGRNENVVLSLKIQSDLAEKIIPDIKDITFNSVLVPYSDDKGEGIDILGKMIARFALSMNGSVIRTDEKVKADLKEILQFIKENFDIVSHALKSRDISSEEREVLKGRYRRIADYIFKHSSEKIGLKDIAEREHLSLYFLSHEIKNLFGDGFQELMNFQRIQDAMKLLLCSDLNSTEIAYECGYSAPRYLSNYFKKILDTTPLKFRKQFRKSRELVKTQIEKRNIPFEQALRLIKSYLSIDRSEEYFQLSDIIIDARCRGQVLTKVWNLDDSELKGKVRLSENEIFPGIESSSLFPAAWIIKNEIAGLGKVPLKEKKFYDNGIKKPAWFSCFFLSLLGNEILGRGDDHIICRSSSSLQILIFNDSTEKSDSDEMGFKRINLSIKNLSASNRVIYYKLDKSNGSIYYQWQQMGEPEYFSEEEIQLLDKILYPKVTFAHVKELADFAVTLPPDGIELIIIKPVLS